MKCACQASGFKDGDEPTRWIEDTHAGGDMAVSRKGVATAAGLVQPYAMQSLPFDASKMAFNLASQALCHVLFVDCAGFNPACGGMRKPAASIRPVNNRFIEIKRKSSARPLKWLS